MSKTAILTTIRSDAHSWNLVFMQALLEEHDYCVINLGTCTPIDQVQDACLKNRPDLVVVSTVNGHGYMEGAELARQLATLEARPEMKVIIGGKLGVDDALDPQHADSLINAGFDEVFYGPSSVDAFRRLLANEGDRDAVGPMMEDNFRLNTRESMKRLPDVMQPFLTWLSGKPLRGEEVWNLTPVHHLVSAIVALTVGVALGAFAVHNGNWWHVLLVPSWLLTIHAVRKLRGMIAHQCSHSNFLPSQKVNDFIGETISILFLTQSYQAYKVEHIRDHHSSKHMTPEDPTVAFLLRMVGVRAGMSREKLWERMAKTLLSPIFHITLLRNRIYSNLLGASLWHSGAIITVWGILLGIVTIAGVWKAFVLIWILPLTVLLHIVECLRLSGKHVFPENGMTKKGRAALASFTHGIFFGDPLPALSLPFPQKAASWTSWWLRLVFYHLPARMLVVPGDAPCHDYHHRHPKAKNWSNYMFERQKEEMDPASGWPAYTEVWGLYAAIDATFRSLSLADPKNYQVEESFEVSAGDMLHALEE